MNDRHLLMSAMIKRIRWRIDIAACKAGDIALCNCDGFENCTELRQERVDTLNCNHYSNGRNEHDNFG